MGKTTRYRRTWDQERLSAVKDFRYSPKQIMDDEDVQRDNTGETGEPFSESQPSSSPSVARAKLERFVPKAEDEKMTSTIHSPVGNRMWDSAQLQSLISQTAVCSACKIGSLRLVENSQTRSGWASKISLVCTNADCVVRGTAWMNTSPTVLGGEAADVNKRAVLAFRLIGRGQSHAASFAAAMNLPAPVSNKPWAEHTNNWGDVSEELLTEELERAAACAKGLRMSSTDMPEDMTSEATVDIPVSLDGSWLTRGKQSRHGFVTAISADTGDVIDRHYMCNTCPTCTRFEKSDHDEMEALEFNIQHQPDCLMNHTGSAASMESAGAVEIFGRSEENYGVRFNPYIGDGDSYL